MSKFKTIFLSVFKKIVDFISIVALILTVLSASLVIFYSEVVKIFDMFGWPQERLVWLTLTLGGLGTAGIAMSRISGGLNSALILAKSEQEINQKTF